MNKRRTVSRRDFLRLTAYSGVGIGVTGVLQACQPAPAPGSISDTTGDPGVEPVQITFWHQWGGVRTEQLEAEIARFEEAHPNISVNAVLHSWDEWPTEQLTAVAGGSPPELALGAGVYLPQFADSGALIPLEPYLQQENINLEETLYSIDYELAQWNGEVWTLPMPKNGLRNVMFYNKAMLEEAGLDPEQPPATWQELEEAANAITVIEGGRLLRNAITIPEDADGFKSWLITNDAEWISDDGRTVLFNSANGIETLEWLVNFADSIYGGWEVVADVGGEDVYTAIYNSQEAMYVSGTWMFGLIRDNAPDVYDNLGIAPRPRNKGQSIGGIPGDDVSIWMLRGSQHPDEAWQLLHYLTIGEGGCNFMKVQVRPSPVPACNEDPYFAENNPWWDELTSMAELEVIFPRTPVNARINTIMYDAVQQALYHRLSPQAALDQAASEAQTVLDEAYT